VETAAMLGKQRRGNSRDAAKTEMHLGDLLCNNANSYKGKKQSIDRLTLMRARYHDFTALLSH
jgi:hypothetical protein